MKLKYTGDPGRYYPSIGIAPEPGKTYELENDPSDGCWAAVSGSETATPTKEAN